MFQKLKKKTQKISLAKKVQKYTSTNVTWPQMGLSHS